MTELAPHSITNAIIDVLKADTALADVAITAGITESHDWRSAGGVGKQHVASVTFAAASPDAAQAAVDRTNAIFEAGIEAAAAGDVLLDVVLVPDSVRFEPGEGVALATGTVASFTTDD